ncbi:Uncharacterised protein [Serratia entomophila]|uniref:hypothetical protein n=1 Tax=Serratia entomophila TaxID=42906 RepID=UPI002179E887|nr:hypothetical protein [Serratia entomophila]CAI1788274.1 Uncharacterised protein [Serratia entomophila]
MDNKLSELSKPAAFIVRSPRGDVAYRTISQKDADYIVSKGYESEPLYSQEYVSALLAELEAKDKRIADMEQVPTIKHMRSVEEALICATDRVSELEAKLATPVRLLNSAAGFNAGTDSVDADVNDRNQPGMVVAVHIDAGDFVKFRGQVCEVKETDFDDHDVTLWFVCGEVLKCAAGCQIEVVSVPEGDEL